MNAGKQDLAFVSDVVEMLTTFDQENDHSSIYITGRLDVRNGDDGELVAVVYWDNDVGGWVVR